MSLKKIKEESFKPKYKNMAKRAYKLIEGSAGIKITKEDVKELMRGVVDFHCHAAPESLVGRIWDEVEIAKRYCDLGAAALVFKSHTFPSAARTLLVRNAVKEYAEQIGKEPPAIFGGITLNYYVGGINPTAVRSCVGYGGKVVWCPTHDARVHRKATGESAERVRKGIYLLDRRGELIPEMEEILGIIADNDMILSTGHVGTRERFALIDAAKSAGVKWIEINHPTFPNCRSTLDEMVEMAKMGAYIGLYYMASFPTFYCPGMDPMEVREIIKKVGAEHIVGATDAGQMAMPPPDEVMGLYIRSLLCLGIDKPTIETILKHNGAKMLGLKSST